MVEKKKDVKKKKEDVKKEDVNMPGYGMGITIDGKEEK